MQSLNVHIYPALIAHQSRVLKVTATLIKKRFVEQIIIVGRSGLSLPSRSQIDKSRAIEGFPISESRRSFLSRSLRFMGWSLRVFNRFRSKKIDMINCHSLSVLPLCLALKIWHRAILIYEPHELETETSQMRGFKKPICKVIEGLLIKHVHWTILVSDSIEAWYRKQYGVVNTSVVMNCPVISPVCASRYFHERYTIPIHTPIFLYQGILGKGRGIELIVNSFGAMPDEAVLVLLGYGELFEWAQTQSKHLKNVYVQQAVPQSELHTITCSADFGFSMPEPGCLNHEYCMPNKLFEYIMGGVPVLVSNTLEQRKVVQQFGIGEIATALTPDAIRAAARRLLSSDRSNFKAGLEQARHEYCWERQEIVLEHVYSQVLQKK